MNTASQLDRQPAPDSSRLLATAPAPENEREASRFTRDGSAELERRLSTLCEQVLEAIRPIIPAGRIAALILAGGYGRGEGGVLRTSDGDQPYNDLEFYLFLKGNRLLNELRFGSKLHALAAQLTPAAGVDIEVKIDSLAELCARSVSMFSYDLVSRHRVIYGPNPFFDSCKHHLAAAAIPPSEAARLLLNRATGLLLAKGILGRATSSSADSGWNHSMPTDPSLSPEESDFVARNLAKMQLGLGDAFLAAVGGYHWSCLERHSRLTHWEFRAQPPSLGRILEEHAKGVEFKLHPYRPGSSVKQFNSELQYVSGLAHDLWLWLESRRLARTFSGFEDYALSPCRKCDPAPAWRNRLLNLRTFGWRELFGAGSVRYPRERLFNSLPLLLWSSERVVEPSLARHLQAQLGTDAADWQGFVSGYRRVWAKYG